MKRSTGKPTIVQRKRFELLLKMGCVACWMGWWGSCQPVEIHHLLSGNRRRGHDFTIPLCKWHHRGEPRDGDDAKTSEKIFGPSLARSSKRFRSTYGTDNELLALVNQRLEAM